MITHSKLIIILSLYTLSATYAMEKRLRTKSLNTTQKVTFDNKIMVYFPANNTIKFNDIKINGLRHHIASFFLNPPANSTNLVCYSVNPHECDVYNAKYRLENDWKSYDATKLPLSTYLEKKQFPFGNHAEVLISGMPPEELKFKERLITRRDALRLLISQSKK